MTLTKTQITKFRKTILAFYRTDKRDFSWRRTTDPYQILISEVMLQQTQTFRVEPKFAQWVTELPNFEALANAPFRTVLALWQGLGYNRRAMWLQQTAQRVVQEFNGVLPAFPEILETFPGIGPNTAASICAFAFNQPTIFIETNIRTVFIHFFFQGRAEVKDAEIRPLVEQTLDYDDPRSWYYALMDYGVMLKKNLPNPSRRSAHHNQQSKFEGSERQIRGLILKVLTTHSAMNFKELAQRIEDGLRDNTSSRRQQLSLLDMDSRSITSRVERNLHDLCQEGFIAKQGRQFSIR